MYHRGHFSTEERQIRSRLAQTMHNKGLIRAGIVKMERVCGKANCRCYKEGKRHISYYLSMQVGGKRKMVYIPKGMKQAAQDWVKNYKEINKGINKLSQHCLKKLKGA